MIRHLWATVCSLMLFTFCSATEPAIPLVQVNLANCVETIGVGLAPTSNVLQMIPETYIPVGISDPVTPIVVRSARCDVTVFGQLQKKKCIVQIGAVIVPPDGTGDINNYTLFYVTDDLRLCLLLKLAGVDVQFAPVISYNIATDNTLNVRVPFPSSARLTLTGNITPSQQTAGSFTANWWQDGPWGQVKMRTKVPHIKIGTADHQLSTPPGSSLSDLAGGGAISFPVLQQFNTFSNASLNVSLP